MNVIFGTTNQRKIEDVKSVIKKANAYIEVLTLNDIGWNRGDIEEGGLH